MTDYSKLIGKPFRDCGRGPDGYDCWGAVIAVAALYGVEIPDYGQVYYSDHVKLIEEFLKHVAEWTDVPSSSRKPGDVVVFKRMDGGLHFGVVIEGGKFIQSTEGMGVHVVSLSHPIYKHLIKGILRKI